MCQHTPKRKDNKNPYSSYLYKNLSGAVWVKLAWRLINRSSSERAKQWVSVMLSMLWIHVMTLLKSPWKLIALLLLALFLTGARAVNILGQFRKPFFLNRVNQECAFHNIKYHCNKNLLGCDFWKFPSLCLKWQQIRMSAYSSENNQSITSWLWMSCTIYTSLGFRYSTYR